MTFDTEMLSTILPLRTLLPTTANPFLIVFVCYFESFGFFDFVLMGFVLVLSNFLLYGTFKSCFVGLSTESST